jgi:hypothetical protein
VGFSAAISVVNLFAKTIIFRNGGDLTYLIGFLWGFIVLACFAGWGLILRRVLDLSCESDSPEWGKLIVMGMASIVALGGFLNLLNFMTRGIIWLLLVGGLSSFAATGVRLCTRDSLGQIFASPTTRLGTLAFLVCVIAYASCVCLCESPYGDPGLRQRFTLNPWDDLNGGYIAGPLRLLSAGNVGDDPFNAYRSHALGGLAVLQAFVLLFLPPTFIHLLDPGLAILTLPFLLHGMGRRRGWPEWLAPVLTLFCLILKTHWVNASTQLLPTVFLLALFDALDGLTIQPQIGASRLIAVALVASALITFKNTLVPGTCLILAIVLIVDCIVRRDLYRTTTSGLKTGLIMLFLLAPWFISSYRAVGTPLYPLLGEGYWANPMGNMPSLNPNRAMAAEARELLMPLKDPRIILLLLLGALGIAVMTRQGLIRQFRGIAYLASLLSSIMVVFAYAHVFHDGWMRHSYNFTVVSLLASFALLLGSKEARAWIDGLIPVGTKLLGALLILLTSAGSAYQLVYARPTAAMIVKSITGKGWDPDVQRESYRQLQSSIPPGQPVVTFLPMAHLFDYNRNPIYMIHLNSGISPPPGLPLEGSPQEIARYLRSRGIKWFATHDVFWCAVGEGSDPEAILRWSESYDADNTWDARLVYSYYQMAKCSRSLIAACETRRFDKDLLLVNLERTDSKRHGTDDSAGHR